MNDEQQPQLETWLRNHIFNATDEELIHTIAKHPKNSSVLDLARVELQRRQTFVLQKYTESNTRQSERIFALTVLIGCLILVQLLSLASLSRQLQAKEFRLKSSEIVLRDEEPSSVEEVKPLLLEKTYPKNLQRQEVSFIEKLEKISDGN